MMTSRTYRTFAAFLAMWFFFLHVPLVVHACARMEQKMVVGKKSCCCKSKKMATEIGASSSNMSCHRSNTPPQPQPSNDRHDCCGFEVIESTTAPTASLSKVELPMLKWNWDAKPTFEAFVSSLQPHIFIEHKDHYPVSDPPLHILNAVFRI
jgi:hypothetical protein